MTDEEKAKKYFEDNKDYYDSREPITDRQLRRIYIDGYEEGRKEKWHDLRKNLNDLPTKENVTIRCVLNNGNEVICETGWYSPTEDEIGYGKIIIQFYCNDDCIDINDVIAWCELPKFEK